MTNAEDKLRKRIRLSLVVFIVGLVVSGLTAIPLEWETAILARWVNTAVNPEQWPNLAHWIMQVKIGIEETAAKYPFMCYGTDWLAFAHLVIAVAFIGPWRDPVRNVWVIQFGMIACAMVIPFALIMGGIRGIPFYWRLIDCSFGVFGILPLWLCHRWIQQYAQLAATRQSPA